MRRRYTAAAFRRLADRLRAARPDLALTTDLIVGFPGETDADFRDTLALVRDVGFVDSFSFKYSPRPGTAAARETDTVPADVAQALAARKASTRGRIGPTVPQSCGRRSMRTLIIGSWRRRNKSVLATAPTIATDVSAHPVGPGHAATPAPAATTPASRTKNSGAREPRERRAIQ